MSEFIETPRLRSNPPGVARAILIGTALGVPSSAVGITGFVAFVIAWGLFSDMTHIFQVSLGGLSYFLVIYAILAFAYAFYAVVPAIIGGGVIGVILQRLARADRFDVRINIAIGALVGLIAGTVTAWLIAPTSSPQGWVPDLPRGPIWNGAIGIVQGLFVSLILGSWLRRRMK